MQNRWLQHSCISSTFCIAIQNLLARGIVRPTYQSGQMKTDSPSRQQKQEQSTLQLSQVYTYVRV